MYNTVRWRTMDGPLIVAPDRNTSGFDFYDLSTRQHLCLNYINCIISRINRLSRLNKSRDNEIESINLAHCTCITGQLACKGKGVRGKTPPQHAFIRNSWSGVIYVGRRTMRSLFHCSLSASLLLVLAAKHLFFFFFIDPTPKLGFLALGYPSPTSTTVHCQASGGEQSLKCRGRWGERSQ